MLEIFIFHPDLWKGLFDLFVYPFWKVQILQFGENIFSLSIALPIDFKSLSSVFL